ncbi:uncharacterized protein [Atheta coriaria]|uniref:uncharacterized protein isoform X1 n=1 Tax=Dalotia coriaria TaxID=877792 RepID=UPI0031F3F029
MRMLIKTNKMFVLLVGLVMFWCNLSEAQQLWVSPCPRLFSYEPQKENDRWFGVVTLTSDTDLKGVWLRVAFDRPSMQLGNWFGEIRTSDNTEYLIHNRNHELKANMPYALRFYIKYDPNSPPPQLIGIRLNARPVCPEGQTTTPAAITGGNQLITSAPDGKDPLGGISQTSSTTPIPQPTTQRRPGQTFSRPGGGWPGSASTDDDDDDVFQGDFQLINRPHLRPQAEPECGTVVMAHERRKRDADAPRRGGVSRHDYHGNHNHGWHQHQSHSKDYRTPNFPQVEYFYVDANTQIQNGVVSTPQFNNAWNLRDWVLNFLNQRYDLTAQHATSTPSTTTTEKQLISMPYVGGVVPSQKSNNSLPPVAINPDQDLQMTNLIKTRVDDDDIAPLEQQPRPLITFGQSTKEGEFPWHVALYHERGADLQYICGASLISRSHVITVAHCVTRRRSATALNPDSLVVYLGKYYLKKWSNPGIQDSQVAAILPHPEYNSQTYANDIAILKLLNPATFSDFVRPICLWGDGQDLEGVLNKPGTVVGWGFDHTGKVTEELTQAKMPVVSKETCIYSFPDFFSRFTTSKTFCAGFRNGTSVCNGDSGGGMVFPKQTSTPNREVWQLRGLVSISVALQNQFKCDSSHYVVFTDVAKYLDWIHEAMRQ